MQISSRFSKCCYCRRERGELSAAVHSRNIIVVIKLGKHRKDYKLLGGRAKVSSNDERADSLRESEFMC